MTGAPAGVAERRTAQRQRLTELALMLTAARSLSPTRGTSPPWTG